MTGAADLVVRGARVWTHGALCPGEDALAVAAGRIVARGRFDSLAPLVGSRTRVIEAAGGTLTPGICDAHLHLVGWARALREIALADCDSSAAVAARVAAFIAAHPGEGVVLGIGWDPNGWPEAPHRGVLDRVAGGRPVVLRSKDTHAVWLNGEALRRAGVTRDTADPPAGRVIRDGAGEPTGVLLEEASRLASGLLAAEPGDDAASLDIALGRLAELGVTAVHDFEGPNAHRLIREALDPAAPRLRVLMHLARAGMEAALDLGLASGTGDDTFRIGAVKLFADGTLGSRTAAMLEPFEGTTNLGIEVIAPAELRDLVRRAFEGRLSVAIHAIGDRAARNAIDAFEASAHAIGRLALPPRIEHLQLVTPDDQARIARLGIGASMQPSHATSDAVIAERHWGARVEHSYPWRSLRDRGALLAFGSDAPVEPPDPSAGLFAAIAREAPGEARAFVPAQRLGLDEALSAYTEGAAKLAAAWPRLGSLAVGSHADLVVWRDDLHALPPSRLRAARPAFTVVGGGVLHEAPAGAGERAAASRTAPAAHRATPVHATGGAA